MRNFLNYFMVIVTLLIVFSISVYFNALNILLIILFNIILLAAVNKYFSDLLLVFLMILHYILYLFSLYLHKYVLISLSPGSDALRFEQLAYNFYREYAFNEEANIFQSSTAYSRLIGSIYYLGKDYIVIPGLINITAHSISIVLIYMIFKQVFNTQKGIYMTILIFILYPIGMITTVTSLRESLITMFILLFTVFVLKYVQSNRIEFLLGSIITLIIGSLFHIGVISLIYIVIFCMIFINKRKNLFATLSAILLSIVSFVLITTSENSKISAALNSNNENLNANDARADYLTSYSGSGLSSIIDYRLPQIFYFFTKPFPWEISTVQDIVGFINVFVILTGLFLSIYIYIKKKNQKILTVILIVMIIYFTYALGTSNYGTALRHRDKISILIVMFWPYYYYFRRTINRNV